LILPGACIRGGHRIFNMLIHFFVSALWVFEKYLEGVILVEYYFLCQMEKIIFKVENFFRSIMFITQKSYTLPCSEIGNGEILKFLKPKRQLNSLRIIIVFRLNTTTTTKILDLNFSSKIFPHPPVNLSIL
jgi:hypothetical protein